MLQGLFTCALAALVVGATAVLATRQVTFISDIHYDPLYGTWDAFSYCKASFFSEWGMPGCDSSPQLTQRALDDVSDQNTSFIFYGGDWQRHGYSKSGLGPATLFSDLSERFRNVTVDGSLGEVAFSGSIGNNDVVPDYYFAWESSASEEQLLYRVQAMEAAGLLNATEAGVMARCGYYTHEMETLNVIVLHTLLWAYRLLPSLTDSVSDPCNQLAFLEAELTKVRDGGKRAVILGHIPPGMNTYNVLQSDFGTEEDDLFWKPEYQSAYDRIIFEYKDYVAVQLFGHTHKFTPQVFPTNGAISLIIPAISPIFNNFPSYLLANFSDDGWALQDMQIRYVDDDGVFRAGHLASAALKATAALSSLPELRASIKALASDDEAWSMFLDMHCGGETELGVFPNSECDHHCRFLVVCSMLENRHAALQQCVAEFTAAWSGDGGGTEKTSWWAAALIVLCSVIVLGVAAVLLLMARSGQMSPSLIDFQNIDWWKSLLETRTTSTEETEIELQNRH